MVNRRRGHRRRRRNPPNGNGRAIDILGTKFPAAETLAYGTVGFLGPPFVEAWVSPMLPANISGNQWGRYLIKGGSVFGLVWATNAFAGRNAAMKVATGGGIYLLASVVNDFLPQITGTTQPATSYYPRLARQPLLGDYGRQETVTGNAPERLRPQSRY